MIHSASAILSSGIVKSLSLTGSYSGRFSRNEDRFGFSNDRSEAISAQLAWMPLSYLGVSLLKSYTIDKERVGYQMGEFVTASAQSTRYISSGVDTRISWSRTWFQQSPKERQVVSGADTTVVRVNKYTTDTWYASFDGSPFPYTRSRYSLSLSRDGEPVRSDQRWLFTQSFDLTANLTQRLDGRMTVTALYQGEKMRLGHVYSKSINSGLNWSPANNMSMSVSYTWSVYNSYLRFVNSNLSVTFSYRFRRAFSMYLTANRQEQPSVAFDTSSTSLAPRLTTNKPTALNAQLQIFVTSRTTANIGYIVSRSDYGYPRMERRARTWLANLNMQL
jgi:hypothetical protein